MLSIGYKNNETVLFIPADGEEVMKTEAKGNDVGWRVYDTVFNVPDELTDNVMEIINHKI